MAHVDSDTGEILEAVDTEKLTRAFPSTALKRRKGGGGMTFTYVDGTTVIHRLIEATGNHYSFAVDRYWSEAGARYALVTLTLPEMGSRSHIGVQAEQAGQGEDALAKGAITDGLKKAATLFGVGLELYGPDLNAGESAPTQPADIPGVRKGVAPAQERAPARPAPPAANGHARLPDSYPKVPGILNTVDLLTYMQENRLNVTGGKMSDALKVARQYGKEVHGIEDIVVGTGDYDEKYRKNAVWPSDIANALGYWFARESAQGDMGGVAEAKEAMRREADPAPQEEAFDDVPF